MNVKGILIEGRDGHEYLVGFGHDETGRLVGPPHLSRRGADGAFHLLEDLREASRIAVAHLGPREPQLIGPGWGQDLFLWGTFAAALKALPAPPTWPPWRPTQ
jgi:hypothetical protein